MGRVEVRSIRLPEDAAAFIGSWWAIYADDPHWVPPIIAERKDFLNPKKNPYFKYGDVQCFMAYSDGKAVGTIAATVDANLQESDPGMGMFGFFEFIDDQAIAQSLFSTACDWLVSKGMKTVRGPFNLTSNHEFGLLVDGFDTDPAIANPHNSAYYPPMYEAIGLRGVMDWYAYWIDKQPMPERIKRVSDRFMDRHPEVTLRKLDMSRFDEEVELFFEVYTDAWESNWGHIPLSAEEFCFAASNMKQIINPDLCWFAFVDGEVAGAAVTLPDANQVAKKMNGRIFPFGWWHFLTGRKKIDAIRVFVLGVRHKFQKLPLGAPLYINTWEECYKLPIRGAEASLVLDNNTRMRGALEKLGGRIYKTYRTYEYELDASDGA